MFYLDSHIFGIEQLMSSTRFIRSCAVCWFVLCLIFAYNTSSQSLSWRVIPPRTDASFRALSVVDDSVIWLAGTKGWVGRSQNGGETWTFDQVDGFEGFDFRSIYAFDNNRAVIANAGAPANILVTGDGGTTWKVVYTHADTSAFFDGIDFWNNQNGIIYGDPIRGRMLLLGTRDGGETWKEISSAPRLNEGEASFAASGTNIRVSDKRTVAIATGGSTSRLWISRDGGQTWHTQNPPVIQGLPSAGIFSFSGFRNNYGAVVGGDYLRDSLTIDHAFYTRDGGKTWNKPATATRGYRECVEFLDDNFLIATGPGGTDISKDGGLNWTPASDEKLFHVVRKARKGSLVVIAGGRGKISIIKYSR